MPPSDLWLPVEAGEEVINDFDRILERIGWYTHSRPADETRRELLQFARDCEELAALWQQLADIVREEIK